MTQRWLLVFSLLLGSAAAQGAGANSADFGYLVLPNDATTGTVLNGPAKTAANPTQVVETSAGDSDARGICIYNCGKTGMALISLIGSTPCVFDGSVTVNDWVQISPTVAGECHDAGASRPTNGKLLGVLKVSGTGVGTYALAQSDVAAIGAVQTDSTGLIDQSLMPTGVIPFPSGAIIMILSGTCPSSFTQVTALNGQFVQGTIAANGDVGTTGGNATITPAGTVTAPVFTGTSNQATSGTSAGTPQGTNAATATSGNCAATNIAAGTGSTTACKATAPNLTVPAETFTGTIFPAHQHTLTPAGTNSAPTFTGAAIDPRPPFTKVIFCSKN